MLVNRMRCWIPKSWTRKLLLLGVGLLVVSGFWFARPGLVEYRLWRARRALKEREAQQALVYLEAAERLDANRAETHFWMARAYRRLGQYDQVHVHLDRAFELGHSVDQLKREELMTLAQNGQLSKAEPHLPKLLIDGGEDGPEICEAFVRGYLDAFQLDRAFELLDGWQADYPDDPQPHYFRGLFWEHELRFSDAADSFGRALELAPHRIDVRLHLARALRERHRYSEAVEHYRRCLEKKPDEPEALAGWGECLRAEGKLEEAREVFVRLLEKSPDDFHGRLAMGEIELHGGRPQQALRWLRAAAEQRPYDFKARYALAQALDKTGHPQQAREHFKFAAASEQAKLHVQALLSHLADEPNNVTYRYEIGTTLLKYGDPSVGAVWLRSVLDLKPDHRETHAALARYYSGQGDDAQAAKHRRLAQAARQDNRQIGPQGPPTP